MDRDWGGSGLSPTSKLLLFAFGVCFLKINKVPNVSLIVWHQVGY